MNKIKVETIQEKLLNDGTMSKVVRLTPTNANDMIFLDDVRKIFNTVRAKPEYSSKKIFVQGMADRRRDLVSKQGIFVSDEDYDEYLDGRVSSTEKFHKFSQVQIMIYGK